MEVSGPDVDAPLNRDIDALLRIRDATRFLWPEMLRLSSTRHEVSCEIMASTLALIRSSLDQLSRSFGLRFEAVLAYDLSDGGSVMTLTLHCTNERLPSLIRDIGLKAPLSDWLNTPLRPTLHGYGPTIGDVQ
jgi:hypothetical protein